MGQICQNAEAETEIGPPSSDRALYSDKAHSFNQSERALNQNFIINRNNRGYWLPEITLKLKMPGMQEIFWQNLFFTIVNNMTKIKKKSIP